MATATQRLKFLEEAAIAAGIDIGIKDKHSQASIPTDFTTFASGCQIKSGMEYVPFRLYDYQVELNKLIDRYPKLIIFKTRQLGASELIGCKMFHRSCLNRAYSGVVLSIGQDESSKISERIQNMPTFNGFQWEYQSSRRVKPVGGGNIYFRPSTDNAARSLPSVNDILIDEADFIPNADKIYSAATPSQKMAGDKAQIFIVSTISEKGEFGWFGQLFSKYNPDGIDYLDRIQKIRRGEGEYGAGFDWWIDETGWCKVLMHWRSHPIYSFIPDFLEKTKRDERLSDDQLQREYNLGIELIQANEKPYKRFNPVLHVLKGRDLSIATYNPSLPLHISLRSMTIAVASSTPPFM